MSSQRYIIVIEKAANNFSAFCPDVPGCAATGKTVEETVTNMREALEFHLDGEHDLQSVNSLAWHLMNDSFDSLSESFYISMI